MHFWPFWNFWSFGQKDLKLITAQGIFFCFLSLFLYAKPCGLLFCLQNLPLSTKIYFKNEICWKKYTYNSVVLKFHKLFYRIRESSIITFVRWLFFIRGWIYTVRLVFKMEHPVKIASVVVVNFLRKIWPLWPIDSPASVANFLVNFVGSNMLKNIQYADFLSELVEKKWENHIDLWPINMTAWLYTPLDTYIN